MVFVALLLIRRSFSGTDRFLGGTLPLFVDSSEFPFPYEISSLRTLGLDFTFKYLGALIDVKVLQAGRKRVLAVRINRPFPINAIIRQNYALLAEVGRVFPVRPWRRRVKQSKLELVMTNKDVTRQLARICEFELILVNKESLVAGRYFASGDYNGETLSVWTSALYNLHVYASKVVCAADLPMEPISVEVFCPFCRESVTEKASTGCETCGTLHHTLCWEENHGCAVFGCQGGKPTNSFPDRSYRQ